MHKLDQFKIYLFMVLFTLLFAGEFIINQVTHSVLVLVDSYYNLFQICTLIFILLDHKTRNETSIRATFGWARFSVLGTLVCHTFFGALVFALIVESLQLILHTAHETTTLKPHLNLFAAICSVSVQLLSCNMIMRLLNTEKHHKFSISSSNQLQMHFVVRTAGKGDELEHVAITEQQANQMIINKEAIHQSTATNHSKLSSNKLNSSLGQFNETKVNETKPNETKPNETKPNDTRLNEKRSSKAQSYTTSLDGSQLKELKQSRTNQQHLTLRIFRNFISCTLLIINSIVGCILLKSKQIELDTADNVLKVLDPIFAIISVTLLTFLVYPEVKQSGLILLQSLPSYIDIDRLKRKLTKRFPMIFEIHELHVWSLTQEQTIATAHIKLKHHFKSTEQFGRFFSELQQFFQQEGIDSVTIQPEFICSNSLKANNNSSCTLNDENENALLQRVPSCLLKCTDSSAECEKNVCCHPKRKGSQDEEKVEVKVDAGVGQKVDNKSIAEDENE